MQMGFIPDKVWADEFLHATFHKLGSLGSQGLTNVIWALAVMPLRPPPAWLYAFVKVRVCTCMRMCIRAELCDLGVLRRS